MWHSYSNPPTAMVMLWSCKIPVNLVNVDSVSEQDGIYLILINRVSVMFGFQLQEVFCLKSSD